jgi:outer membrane receptor protein involved in Fe transport
MMAEIYNYELATITCGIEEELRLGSRLWAIAGASYDVLDPIEVAGTPPGPVRETLNPQGGVVYKPTMDLTLHASVGKKTSFPTMRDLYWDKEEGGCWIGNPELLPEEAWTVELGAEQKMGDNFTLDLAIFRNDIHNLITTVALFDMGQYWRRDNIEKALIQGLETGLKFRLTPDFTGTMNYTYLETENKTSGSLNGEDLLYRPKHQANLGLRYAFDGGFDLSIQLTGSSEKTYYWAPSDQCLHEIPPEERPQGRIPAYLTSNTKFSWIFSKHTSVFLAVKNIFDANYVDRGSPKMGYEPMPGREALVGFKLSL